MKKLVCSMLAAGLSLPVICFAEISIDYQIQDQLWVNNQSATPVLSFGQVIQPKPMGNVYTYNRPAAPHQTWGDQIDIYQNGKKICSFKLNYLTQFRFSPPNNPSPIINKIAFQTLQAGPCTAYKLTTPFNSATGQMASTIVVK